MLSALFSDACENGLISVNPVTKSVKCPKKPEKNTRVLTLDEQDKFLTVAKESINYNHFLFILQTGVRSRELRGLKWSDIDFENRIIHIIRNVTYDSNNTKFIVGELKTGSGQRDIPMTQTVYDLLLVPAMSISKIVNLIPEGHDVKSYTTFHIWKRYPAYLQKHFWKERTFWTDGYFACSVGNVSEEMLRKYIENQFFFM